MSLSGQVLRDKGGLKVTLRYIRMCLQSMAMQIEELKSRLALLEHVNRGLLRPFLATNPSREATPKSQVEESAKVVPLAHKPKQATEEGARKNAQTQHKASLNKSADSLLKDMKAMGAKLPE